MSNEKTVDDLAKMAADAIQNASAEARANAEAEHAVSRKIDDAISGRNMDSIARILGITIAKCVTLITADPNAPAAAADMFPDHVMQYAAKAFVMIRDLPR